MALGVMGFYTALYLVVKLLPKSKKAPEAAPVASSNTEMPSVDSAEFGEWVGKDGNIEKLIASA
jgi:hypothetical protein